MLIINADDWGIDARTTDAIAACFRRRRVTATSAMVFMDDSIRAANIAREIDIDVGLHLNLTEPFTSDRTPPVARDAQRAVARALRDRKFADLLFHPALHTAFRNAIDAQLTEFRRLYGRDPSHIDGHHHKHLGSNILLGGLLPRGAIVRRHFTFFPGERSWANRAWRGLGNRMLGFRCRLLDGFFDLTQYMNTPKMQRLAELSRSGNIELMAHPAQREESQYLCGSQFGEWLSDVELADFRELQELVGANAHPGRA